MRIGGQEIPKRRRRLALAGALVGLALVLAACGAGTIDIDGSSTVFPISEAMVEEFAKVSVVPSRLVIGISGTGGGFKKFCAGETDINNASRPIKQSEVEKCAENGVEYIELPIAIDGITITVNPDNDFVQCLTVADLHAMWSPEAEGKIKRWIDVRPEWPDQTLRLYGPGVDSGTFDYFTRVINGEAQASRGDFTSSERDNVLVQGVSGDRSSLGYFGYAFALENRDILKVVAVDGGNGCVFPTSETINDGSYEPLSRPLLMYVARESADVDAVKDFVRYHISPERERLIEEVGFVAFPARVYELALARFEKGLTGTLFGGSDPQQGTVEEILASNQ
ncbi:MAG: PstS family phosphate ABC transporter substrate-binding protein [Chloroflexi bacterium]|nr:PstS family phosphate ABC transporter substrate-binding protein [Chloroflexota bacterium]